MPAPDRCRALAVGDAVMVAAARYRERGWPAAWRARRRLWRAGEVLAISPADAAADLDGKRAPSTSVLGCGALQFAGRHTAAAPPASRVGRARHRRLNGSASSTAGPPGDQVGGAAPLEVGVIGVTNARPGGAPEHLSISATSRLRLSLQKDSTAPPGVGPASSDVVRRRRQFTAC